jgi:hypothetical protein
MDFLFGGFAGVAGMLALQAMMSHVGRARVYDVDGRKLVEFMHRTETQRGVARAVLLTRTPTFSSRPLPSAVPRGVDGASPANGTRPGLDSPKGARLLRVVATAASTTP